MANQATLRHSIVRAYQDVKKAGHCSLYEFESIMHMFEQYTRLGGNGFVKDLIEKLKKIPISEE